ncbi:MAG: helix-turn-helix transcriptional regulator [Clostridia bacterium]|nr:helix-turn-helix transcriptional regulator [Clostridia bacterium]
MFFKTKAINCEPISVFLIERPKCISSGIPRPYHALSFRLEGNSSFKCKDTYMHAKSKDIVFAPAYLQYELNCEEEVLYIVHFNSDTPLSDDLLIFTPSFPHQYEKLFSEMYYAHLKKHPGYEYEVKSLFYKILSLMEKDSASKNISDTSAKIEALLSYIHDNFTDRNMSVSLLSQKLNMSETYFRKVFSDYTGKSPLSYINDLRLAFAKELLCSGYYTISEVSEMCGFCTPYYFSAFIKKNTGLSPKELSKKGL